MLVSLQLFYPTFPNTILLHYNALHIDILLFTVILWLIVTCQWVWARISSLERFKN